MTREARIRIAVLALLVVVLIAIIGGRGLLEALQYPIQMIVVAVAAVLLLVKLFQVCWNYSVSLVFGFNEINYWQAFGLLIVARLLFGGVTT